MRVNFGYLRFQAAERRTSELHRQKSDFASSRVTSHLTTTSPHASSPTITSTSSTHEHFCETSLLQLRLPRRLRLRRLRLSQLNVILPFELRRSRIHPDHPLRRDLLRLLLRRRCPALRRI